MAHAPGRFSWTSVQLNYVFNINYQPFGTGGHFTKRQDVKMEWEQLFPRAGEEFHEIARDVALDAGMAPPTDHGGVQALYTRFILDDNMSTVKRLFMKQSSWYSIIQHIHSYDKKWHSRRFQTEQAAQLLKGRVQKAKHSWPQWQGMSYRSHTRTKRSQPRSPMLAT